MGGGGDEYNFGPVSIIIPNMNQIYHMVWKICLFVLRFYGPINTMGSCRARSVYLTTCLLGRLSPQSG